MFVFDLVLATRRKAMTGIERYGVHLFKAVRKIAPDSIAFVYDTQAFADKRGLVVVPDVYRSWLLLPRLIRRKNLAPRSIVFPTAPASPLFRPTQTPLCRIIHDAFPWTRAEGAKLKSRLLFRDVERFMAPRYDRLCGTTEPVAMELIPLLGRTDIGWCGNAPGLDLWNIEPKKIEGLPSRFILAVGTVEPRKDYARLIRLAEAAQGDTPPIVIVGRPGWGGIVTDLETAANRLPHRLIWLRDLTEDGALLWLYRNAACFISLSLAEGFNMPLVEAAMCGRPVLCSDLPIHRHVAPPWARFIAAEAPADRIWSMVMEDAARPAEADVDDYRRAYSWDNVASRLLRIIGS